MDLTGTYTRLCLWTLWVSSVHLLQIFIPLKIFLYFLFILTKLGYMCPGSIGFKFGTQQRLIIVSLFQSTILTLRIPCAHLLPPTSLCGAREHPRGHQLWSGTQDLMTCCPLAGCWHILFWQMMWTCWSMETSEILRHFQNTKPYCFAPRSLCTLPREVRSYNLVFYKEKVAVYLFFSKSIGS